MSVIYAGHWLDKEAIMRPPNNENARAGEQRAIDIPLSYEELTNI